MASNKKTLYVGGLADDVDVSILRSAFLPFGNIIDVNLPMDYTTQKHKGFAFIEYQLPEDAADAIDNMDNAEILGRTIRVNPAKPVKYKDINNRPIWSDDAYLREMAKSDDKPDDSNKEDMGDVAIGSDDEDSSDNND